MLTYLYSKGVWNIEKIPNGYVCKCLIDITPINYTASQNFLNSFLHFITLEVLSLSHKKEKTVQNGN